MNKDKPSKILSEIIYVGKISKSWITGKEKDINILIDGKIIITGNKPLKDKK
jgi:archaellum component FlaG (FlaF/FlaG flagellin family)